ncbi:uncharacterized protein AB675_3992 [Cyphellophora attinorum]|uniref:AB hydrolase-1 domain-containing protein n=1 Tax=Cyphellophora attinorum TaxID=1664694 RepID=A0A0N0NK53_9EURO|nr:uncharacterized protein AB675_3992 [Phialophora attinorum]KPI37648.1 hypothetical protein AB675_3992 [Phialophora attinorum]
MVTTKDITLAHTFAKINDASSSPSSRTPVLLVFINGLMLPRKQWSATLNQLSTLLASRTKPIYTLTYDRYGQGESRSPDNPDWKPTPHDLSAAATELDALLADTLATHATELGPHPTLIFVSHSIGVPLARIHNQQTTNSKHLAAAHLFLDSNIANTDFISIFPDPDSPDFDPSIQLPEGTTPDDLRGLRQRTRAMFHPSIPNPEGLDRSNLAELLPNADKPTLRGPEVSTGKETSPYLTVVGHDPVAFAQEGLRMQGTHVGFNEMYMQPVWDAYNEGLMELVAHKERVKGVIIAEGAGHFVQRDTPEVVARQVVDLIQRVEGGK